MSGNLGSVACPTPGPSEHSKSRSGLVRPARTRLRPCSQGCIHGLLECTGRGLASGDGTSL